MKTSLTIDSWSVTNARNVATNENKTTHATTRNIHFYDENANDESKIVIEDRFS